MKFSPQPLFSFEIKYHTKCDDQDDSPSTEICPAPPELWQELEIHTVDPGNECHRDVRIMITRAINKNAQVKMAIRVAFFAFAASHQLRGRIP